MGIFSFLTRPLTSSPPSSSTLPTPLTTPMAFSYTGLSNLIPDSQGPSWVTPCVCPLPTHCAPALENCCLIPQHTLLSCASACSWANSSPRIPTLTSSGDLACPSISTRVTSPGKPSFTCKWTWCIPPSDLKTMCSVPGQGPDAQQNNLGDTVRQLIFWAMCSVPKPSPRHLKESGKEGEN